MKKSRLSETVATIKRLGVLDKETGAELFNMTPPLVYDAVGNQTFADITLSDRRNYIRMEYAVDQAFLSQAVYPVTIDPVVQTSTTNAAVCDAYIWKNNPNTNYGSVHLIRCGDGEGGESISLIKFERLIKIRSSDTILSAQLRVSPYEYAGYGGRGAGNDPLRLRRQQLEG